MFIMLSFYMYTYVNAERAIPYHMLPHTRDFPGESLTGINQYL